MVCAVLRRAGVVCTMVLLMACSSSADKTPAPTAETKPDPVAAVAAPLLTLELEAVTVDVALARLEPVAAGVRLEDTKGITFLGSPGNDVYSFELSAMGLTSMERFMDSGRIWAGN